MVIFTSQRPIGRAENITALYNAYQGDKKFIQLDWWRHSSEIAGADLMVTDEIPAESPGKVIFIQHGITGSKYYGLDQPRAYATREQTNLITYAVTQSEASVPLMAKQLGLPEDRVLALGMPRTDLYYGVHKGDGRTGYADKIVYLYAPTYRQRQEEAHVAVDFDALDMMLSDDEVLLVKPHMLTPKIISGYYRHITEISNKEPSMPFLIDCDALITDYSSIMFDAYVMRRPVVLFSKDDGYLRSRGMYYRYPSDYSRYFADNERDLIKTARAALWTDGDDKRREFFASKCDGHSIERIIKLIDEVKDE